jgi:GNAT superfamily N-acetyltransferase
VLEIREADFGDAAQIAVVKRATWPDEDVCDSLIQGVLSLHDHQTHLAVCDGVVVGFACGFLTRTANDVPRWELDLLAVHPDFRGRGLAPKLIVANTDAGRNMGALTARGLVQVENAASQRAFVRAGYTLNTEPHRLYIMSSNEIRDDDVLFPEGLHLVPVYTMNYKGLWLEGTLLPAGIRYAQRLCRRDDLDLVGAVIPQSEFDSIRTVKDAGFSFIGQYQWWTLDLSETSGAK